MKIDILSHAKAELKPNRIETLGSITFTVLTLRAKQSTNFCHNFQFITGREKSFIKISHLA